MADRKGPPACGDDGGAGDTGRGGAGADAQVAVSQPLPGRRVQAQPRSHAARPGRPILSSMGRLLPALARRDSRIPRALPGARAAADRAGQGGGRAAEPADVHASDLCDARPHADRLDARRHDHAALLCRAPPLPRVQDRAVSRFQRCARKGRAAREAVQVAPDQADGVCMSHGEELDMPSGRAKCTHVRANMWTAVRGTCQPSTHLRASGGVYVQARDCIRSC
mmetsp:Transcript_45891/g.120329  ORF Transcript_45891/g.120329 Transcript_45891/m.120329 type:complete len:224 (-) Transcript_45891:293-964(-)